MVNSNDMHETKSHFGGKGRASKGSLTFELAFSARPLLWAHLVGEWAGKKVSKNDQSGSSQLMTMISMLLSLWPSMQLAW